MPTNNNQTYIFIPANLNEYNRLNELTCRHSNDSNWRAKSKLGAAARAHAYCCYFKRPVAYARGSDADHLDVRIEDNSCTVTSEDASSYAMKRCDYAQV